MARAMVEPPFSVQKARVLFYYLDSVKISFKHLAMHMLSGLGSVFKQNPAWTSMVIYVPCTGIGLMMWILMGFLDLTAGSHVLETVTHVMQGLNEHVLPALQLLNGLLALLFGFSTLLGMLNINRNISLNSNRSRIDPYNTILSGRYKMIKALPKAKYGCLRRSDDVNMNDSSSSACAICLESIGKDDGIRILPNCRHYFHISCIERWLLLCPTNSSCPLCRATVIGLHC